MKAVILAAGKGKRMGDLTRDLPKPMMQVRGKPVLEHIITGLRDHAKIKNFFIVTGHRAEIIQNYFGDGKRFQITCAYGLQEIPDGTGRAPELAAEWLNDDPFLLTYGDILIDPRDYAGMTQAFTADGAIAVTRGEDIRQGGAVIFDQNFFLKDIIEKSATPPPPPYWYNAGIYILPPTLFTYTRTLPKSPRGEYELTDALRAMSTHGLRLQGYQLQHTWADVRDPATLAQLNQSPISKKS